MGGGGDSVKRLAQLDLHRVRGLAQRRLAALAVLSANIGTNASEPFLLNDFNHSNYLNHSSYSNKAPGVTEQSTVFRLQQQQAQNLQSTNSIPLATFPVFPHLFPFKKRLKTFQNI